MIVTGGSRCWLVRLSEKTQTHQIGPMVSFKASSLLSYESPSPSLGDPNPRRGLLFYVLTSPA